MPIYTWSQKNKGQDSQMRSSMGYRETNSWSVYLNMDEDDIMEDVVQESQQSVGIQKLMENSLRWINKNISSCWLKRVWNF